MKYLTQKALVLTLAAGTAQTSFGAENLAEMFSESKASGNFNLRYEDVDNSALTSDGLTLRTRIGVTTGTLNGFSATVTFDDVRDVLGIDDENGLIPDNEVTELDQALIQYKSGDNTFKVGRQVITFDNHRFIGHVAWRQDRVTYDAARYTGKIGGFTFDAAYIVQDNLINGSTERNADHAILHGAIATGIGNISPYAYLLDVDGTEIDTVGARLTGTKSGFGYTVEFAAQETDAADTMYTLLEGSYKFSDALTVKLGYEVRGSDDGAGGFLTPLGTNHAHNGWADLFLGNPGTDGLTDAYVSLAGKAGPVSLLGVYHQFDSDEGSVDKGSEINLQASMPLGNGFTGALKYADYSAGDINADRTKIWAWVSYSF